MVFEGQLQYHDPGVQAQLQALKDDLLAEQFVFPPAHFWLDDLKNFAEAENRPIATREEFYLTLEEFVVAEDFAVVDGNG